jgi:hypothetical protein
MLTLNPIDRPAANKALDHDFFYEQPLAQNDIGDLLKQFSKVINLKNLEFPCMPLLIIGLLDKPV